jgi:hypothetical protein
MEFERYYLDLFEMLNTCCKKKVPPVNMTRPIPSNYLDSQKKVDIPASLANLPSHLV